MICQYCSNEFKTSSSLNNHIKNAKYCIELRNEKQQDTFKCSKCDKVFTSKYRKEYHEKTCNSTIVEDENKLEIRLLKQRIEDKDNMIKDLNKDNITSKTKINKSLNGLEECDTEEECNETCITYSVEVELRKLDIQVEIERINAEKDKSKSKIESITELFKNKIISFDEYKEMMMSF